MLSCNLLSFLFEGFQAQLLGQVREHYFRLDPGRLELGFVEDIEVLQFSHVCDLLLVLLLEQAIQVLLIDLDIVRRLYFMLFRRNCRLLLGHL